MSYGQSLSDANWFAAFVSRRGAWQERLEERAGGTVERRNGPCARPDPTQRAMSLRARSFRAGPFRAFAASKASTVPPGWPFAFSKARPQMSCDDGRQQ